MNAVIDRIEEDLAVCQDDEKAMFTIPAALLPEGAKEGDSIRLEGETWVLDPDETQSRRERIRRKMESLFEP